MTESPIEAIYELLDRQGCRPRQRAGYLKARCPVPEHTDRTPSLSVTESDKTPGKAVVRCHAGCQDTDVLSALGLTVADLYADDGGSSGNGWRIAATYDYVDAEGRLLFQAVRFDPKDFRQRQPDGEGGWAWNLRGAHRVLYRLPEVVEAVDSGRMVLVVEGEKDADRLADAGLVATTCPMGAGKWSDDYTEALAGGHVAVLPDNDDEGRQHAHSVAEALHGVAASVRVVELPGLVPKGDVSTWLADGHDVGELKGLVRDTEPFEPHSRQIGVGGAYGSNPASDAESGTFGSGLGENGGRTLTLVSAADITPRRARFLWTPRVPLGELTLAVGVGGLGKTLAFLGSIAAEVSTGRLDGDTDGPASVVIATAEDTPSKTLVPRLMAAGADLSRVDFVRVTDAGFADGLTLPDDIDQLGRLVDATDARLLLLDPLVAMLSDALDSHKDHSIRRALAPLRALAVDTGAAVLGIAHLNKRDSGDLYSRVNGSSGMFNAVRSLLAVTPDPDATDGDDAARVLVHGKCNLAPLAPTVRFRVEPTTVQGVDGETIPVPVVEWGDDAPGVDAWRALTQPRGAERTKLDEAEAWLASRLADGSVPSADVKKEAGRDGISERTLDRAADRLGVDKHREGFGPGGQWVWTAPSPFSPSPNPNPENRDASGGSSHSRHTHTFGENGENGDRCEADGCAKPLDVMSTEDGSAWCKAHVPKGQRWQLAGGTA